MYGLTENQFKRFFVMAEKTKGVTGTNLLVFLERRLDNMVYRLGFAVSRKEARQVVSHSHVSVNGKNGEHSVVSRERGRRDQRSGTRVCLRSRMPWSPSCAGAFPRGWKLDKEAMTGKIRLLPTREDISVPIKEQLIVEYYSR